MPLPTAPPPTDWTLTAERTSFTRTGRYEEAVAFSKRLAAASGGRARAFSFGITPQNRQMIALLLAPSLRRDRPLVLLMNGIHSGEIEGKDASLMLARDLLIKKLYPEILRSVDVLIVPVLGVDAHERFGPYNRINQNGPAQMGWRTNAKNYNLNRDWLKADAVEMRAMLNLMGRYGPDLMIDTQTTDGGDWQYVLQYDVPSGPPMDPAVAAWASRMIGAVAPRLDAAGYLTAPYFGGIDPADPAKGSVLDWYSPRYSNGYMSAINRPSMLIETHMLKPYSTRVQATYRALLEVLRFTAADAAKLLAANRAADQVEAATSPGRQVVLDAKPAGEPRPWTFLGYAYTPYKSELTGEMVPKWDRSRPIRIDSKLGDTFAPSLTLTAPAGYVVPAEWREVIDLLSLQGIKFRRLRTDLTLTAPTSVFESVQLSKEPFEGRVQPGFTLRSEVRSTFLARGSAIVPIAQPRARLLMHMLEPEAPDSLARWGFFNTVFEPKEYFEAYAMEPIAAKLLADNSALKAEYERALRERPEALATAAQKLDWLYQRSPYFDRRLNVYPVLRLDGRQMRRLLNAGSGGGAR